MERQPQNAELNNYDTFPDYHRTMDHAKSHLLKLGDIFKINP